MINTSERIKNIVSVISNDTLVDVGTDHGFIAILAVQSGKANKVIACDLNKGPLEACKRNIIKYDLKDNIETCLSNGYKEVTKEYETVTICGMGGSLICEILSNDQEKTKKFNQLILQPQSHHFDVRKKVYEYGFYIKEEIYFIDNLSRKNGDNKFYVIFNCIKGENFVPTEKELMLGLNIQNKEVYIEYIENINLKSKVAYENLIKNAKTDVFVKKDYYEKMIKYSEEILNDFK